MALRNTTCPSDYEPQLPGGANGVGDEVTKGSKLLSGEPDPSKFEGEDEEPDKPKWQVPQSQAKKFIPSKYNEARGVYVDDDTPLDDPIAEKLRKQRYVTLVVEVQQQHLLLHNRLIEEADYAATQELFGATVDLDAMLPKSAKDFEQFAEALVAKYLLAHCKSPHYKLLVKQVRRCLCGAGCCAFCYFCATTLANRW